MRKFVLAAGGITLVATLGACGKRGFDRARPDEFAVARQAPLVVPPDFALVPPSPGTARQQAAGSQAQTLDALFGGTAQRSAAEANVVDRAAGGTGTTTGIRSSVGDPATNVIDKGQTTRDIVAAPQGDGQYARAAAGGTAPAPAPTPTPQP